MADGTIDLAEAVASARTGDLWIFRGRSVADRAIQVATNAPVNHVAVAVVVDDLPPLLWHAELGRKLLDVWSLEHRRGAQLHRLEDAARRWHDEYGQRAWVRQLSPELDAEATARVLAVVDDLDGAGFPSARSLAWRWSKGRLRRGASMELAYCAEVAALTLVAAGVLTDARPPNWYDPGRFWSGDSLPLVEGRSYGREVAVRLDGDAPAPRGPRAWARRLRQRWT